VVTGPRCGLTDKLQRRVGLYAGYRLREADAMRKLTLA
jgi:hypothetical protein